MSTIPPDHGINGKAGRYADLILSLSITSLPLVLGVYASPPSDAIPLKILPSIMADVAHTPRLLMAILVFILIVLAVHLWFGYWVWRLWRPFAASLDYPASRRRLLAALFFILMQAAIIGLNSLLFPNSALRTEIPEILLALGGSGFFAMLCWHAKHSAKLFTFQWRRPSYAAIATVALLLGGFMINTRAGYSNIPRRDAPDIIIIGLDSFRPDHLKQTGDTASITPNLDRFLNGAHRFDRTYTPMARTYPAWMSILSGRYPIEHGARFNLLGKQHLIDRERSLPFLLKKKGYTTVYSIDETRFSNIDHEYGFDFTVTPKIGAADFLLGGASDLPLANLFNLAPLLHEALFSHQFINRPVYKTYEPANFDAQLDHLVKSIDPRRPIFWITHFELPHWPYDWRGSKDFAAPENKRLAGLSPVEYQKAVHRTDAQFGALLESLRRNGRLTNAIVVALSDHGEGFEDFAPSWHTEKNGKTMTLPPFSQHGVNVLDEAQTRVLLAFRLFGRNLQASKDEGQNLASLVDVAPTLVGLAGFNKQELNATGCDLFANEGNRPGCGLDRVVYTESGFYPPSLVQNQTIDPSKVAEEAYAYYDVNSDARLTLKEKFLQKLFDDKQRAVISDHGIAASLPAAGVKQFLFGDLTRHTYRNAEDDSLTTEESRLMRSLCMRYAEDNAEVDAFCQRHASSVESSRIRG